MTPEIADVTIRLEATANTPGAALRKVATASQAVLAAARDHGVAEAARDTFRLEGFHLSTPDTMAARSDAAVSTVIDAPGAGRLRAPRTGDLYRGGTGLVALTRARNAESNRSEVVKRRRAPIQAGIDEVTARLTVTFQITH